MFVQIIESYKEHYYQLDKCTITLSYDFCNTNTPTCILFDIQIRLRLRSYWKYAILSQRKEGIMWSVLNVIIIMELATKSFVVCWKPTVNDCLGMGRISTQSLQKRKSARHAAVILPILNF